MRLVIADNDPVVLELLTLDLTLEGHIVVEAVLDGEQAVQACARSHPDALVVDYRMPPGPHGLEVIAAVRERTPDVVCLLYTNYQSTTVREQAARLGATYVPKSTLSELREALAGAAGDPTSRP